MTSSKDLEAFDCVEFKRQAQARIYPSIKGLGPDEEIAYFRRAADEGPLGDWWRSLAPGPGRGEAAAGGSADRQGTGACGDGGRGPASA